MSNTFHNDTPAVKDALEKFGVPRDTARIGYLTMAGITKSMSQSAALGIIKAVALAYHHGAGRVGDETKQFGL